jgi:hypothetical protein
MPKDTVEPKYHFVNKAGKRFAKDAVFDDHQMTLRVKDGGKWSKDIKVAPGERHDYAVKKGVSEIEVKSHIVGWPKYRLNMATANPTYDLFVEIVESTSRMQFDVNYA